MTTTLKNLTCPAGTSGYAVEPWAAGEIYAVAANWSQASAPVYTYGANGWGLDRAGRQVADFRHRAKDALRDEITYAIATSEGIPSDEVNEDTVEAIVDEAVSISSETPAMIGERIGRAIADTVRTERLPREWTGLDPQDGDQLLAAGFEIGTPEWDEAEAAAEAEYHRVIGD